MPIISSSPSLNSIVKGSPATFTLSKADLLLVPSVAASPYYSISSNWESVILNYQSSTLNQPETVFFDATQLSPTGIFDVALSALDIFLIQSILIVDFQGGVFTVPRSELNPAEFDVDMSGASYPFTRDFAAPNSFEANETFLNAIVSGNLLVFQESVQYIAYYRDLSVDGLTVTLGQSYNLRIYIDSVQTSPAYDAQIVTFGMGVDNVYGGSPSMRTMGQIRAAVGSYMDIPITAEGNIDKFGIGQTGNLNDRAFKVSKYIISEV